MKKLFLAATVALMGVVGVNAQEQGEGLKGKTFILGQVGYATENDGDSQEYSILPAVGTFISPSVAVGGAIGYVGSKDDFGGGRVDKENLFIIQPFARKYWSVAENFHIFGQVAVPIGFGKYTHEGGVVGSYDYKYSTYGVEVAPGLDYFFSPNWSIEATVGIAAWSSFKPKDGDATNDFAFGLNSGLVNGLKFGVKYVF